jgi:hypothetical protein
VSQRGAGLALAAAAAYLVGAAAAGQALEVQVTTVKATTSGPSDAQLLQLRPRLRNLVPTYRAFRVVQHQKRECAWRNRQAFVLPGGRELYVIPKGLREQAVLLQVRLMDGSRALLDTDVRLQNRGVMMFGVQRGARADDGALIIMLRAED